MFLYCKVYFVFLSQYPYRSMRRIKGLGKLNLYFSADFR